MIGVNDYERALIKLRAWEALTGWGVQLPLSENPTLDERLDRVRVWTFEERMKKADELAAWALRPCKEKEEANGDGDVQPADRHGGGT